MANPDARERLRQHFSEGEASDHPGKWDDLYREDFTPWDRGIPSPALSEVLSRRDLVGEPAVVVPGGGKRRKRALVPGCGKGYDVLLLAAFGYDAVGLETSELALKAARENEERRGGEEMYKVRDESFGKGKITWVVGDFFKDDWSKKMEADSDGTFDVIYDYTVCSLLPDMELLGLISFDSSSLPSHHLRELPGRAGITNFWRLRAASSALSFQLISRPTLGAHHGLFHQRYTRRIFPVLGRR